MRRIALKLNGVRAARKLRSGASRETVSDDFSISSRNIEKIELLYRDIPDALLAAIERVLDDKEKLRRLVSSLLRRDDFEP
jgi:hypothetical protein